MRRRPAAWSPVDLIGEQDAVGREREIGEALLRRQQAHQHIEITAQQRLAARESEPVHAERQEDVDERADLLEVQDVLARQPHVLFLRHAVLAAEVAAVGDRQPQVFQRTVQEIKHN